MTAPLLTSPVPIVAAPMAGGDPDPVTATDDAGTEGFPRVTLDPALVARHDAEVASRPLEQRCDQG